MRMFPAYEFECQPTCSTWLDERVRTSPPNPGLPPNRSLERKPVKRYFERADENDKYIGYSLV